MATPAAKSLAGLPLGTSAIVRRVASARAIARRLMELGLVPGTRVTVTRVAPLGDPLELRVRNYALSIRRTEALSIEVDETVA
jgi:Fe2+ transport system protein FeoA